MRVASFSPSFSSIVPIKKIVIGNQASNKGQLYMNFDTQSIEDGTQDNCTPDNATKIIQTLCRVLAKNDDENASPQMLALNEMLRAYFSLIDKSYKLPQIKLETDSTSRPRPCYTNSKNYILTGSEASEYYANGKGIGQSRALVRDYNAPKRTIKDSKKYFGDYKTNILKDKSRYLRGSLGAPLGLVIYAEKLPRKKRATTDSFEIKSVKFEPV